MVVTCVCVSSKWVESIPIHSNNSKETADFLFD